MIEDVLTKIGLAQKESRVYMTCLERGQATMTEIARAAGLKRPTAYLIVEALLMRGYLSMLKKGKRAYYIAEHPRRFLQLLKVREREMERILPELEALYDGPKDKPRVRMYEGKEAMLRLYDEMFAAMLERRSEVLFFSAIGDLEEFIPEALESFYKTLQRLPRDYRMREIDVGDSRGVAYAKRMRAIQGKNHHVRILDPARFSFSNTDNLIFENKLVIFSLRKDIFATVLESKAIADTYRAMFNAAWEAAKEVQ